MTLARLGSCKDFLIWRADVGVMWKLRRASRQSGNFAGKRWLILQEPCDKQLLGHRCAVAAHTLDKKRNLTPVRAAAHTGWDWSGAGHFSGTIGLWSAQAAANASLLTSHQPDNMSEINPGMPPASLGSLKSCTQKGRLTFCTQNGDFGLLCCTCVRSSWICRYGEQRNGAAPRDAPAAGFLESAQLPRTHNAVAGTRVQPRCARIQLPTKHLRSSF